MHESLAAVAKQYPGNLRSHQFKDVRRIAFNISLALGDRDIKDLSICDLGGGIGLFSIGCAALGAKRTVLVDDFRDPVNFRVGNSVLDLHRAHGVEVVSRDVVSQGIDDLEGPFDVITSFDSMEHWHASPKRLFAQVIDKLRPGGRFVLGVPNCVNMRKRVTVPFGLGKWSPMAEWYEEEAFRGHVREPDVGDLHYIAADMGLVNVKIHGRNWLGYHSGKRWIRAVVQVFDHPLRAAPSLCADIYMTGQKPA